MTFTPLLGMSEVVMLFLTEDQLRGCGGRRVGRPRLRSRTMARTTRIS